MKYARVQEGLVTETRICDLSPGILWYPFSGDVAVGWTFINNVFSPPVVVPDPLTKEQKQEQMWAAIKQLRENRVTLGGYKVNVGGSDKWFHSDTFSRTQQMGIVMMGSSLPSGIQWKTMDGSFVEMTPVLAASIFNAASIQDQQTFAAAEEHKAAMLLVDDPLTYNYTGGWPKIYGE